jgi:hypothetical protein
MRFALVISILVAGLYGSATAQDKQVEHAVRPADRSQ